MRAVSLASAARLLYGATRGLVDLLHLRPAARWVMRHAPGWLRVRVTGMLIRIGYDAPVAYRWRENLHRCMKAALSLLPDPHVNYMEFGVYVGTSMIAMHDAARAEGRSISLFGFDSFEGLPASASSESGGFWHKGQYRSGIDITRTNLRRHGVDPNSVRLVPGWFEQSLTAATRESLGVDRVDIVMMDSDLESSTRIALEFCTPLIERTVVFFDDWDIEGRGTRGMGEARAFQAWLSAHPQFKAEDLPGLRYREIARAFLVSRTH
jgi:predicted O-methyltransferase YrrM